MRSKGHLSLREQAASRPRRPIYRKAVRFVSLLVCIGGAGLLLGCPADFEAMFGREQPPPPAVLGISPDRGPVLGGTQVTIIGTNTAVFGPGTDVLFGAFLATETEVVNENTIRATAPPQAAGHVDVIVRVASGSTATNRQGFEYVAMKDADGEIIAQIEQMFPGPPRLVSAVALNNTSARVTFSEPVRSGATDASNYNIVIPEGGMLLLDKSKAPELNEHHTVVDLTTLSQADALYRLTVTGIHDLAGNPIASPDLLVNPAETTFTGIAPVDLDEHIDTDGDGFADWFEMLGWQMTIELADGTRTQGYVTSDPYNPDTDGDGMTDGEENARSMDPRTDDTDADLVLDAEEVFDWRSNPCDQDSDDDGFADQTEVHFGTSLILADTDGDQLDDRDELLNRNRNPHIADLPIVVITVGEMNLELDERYTYTDQFGQEHQVQESFSNTVQRDTSSSLSNTISTSFAAHIESKIGAKAGGEVGGKTGTTGYEVSGKVYGEVYGEVTAGLATELAMSSTKQSSQSTSRTYNQAVNRVSQLSSISGITRETVGARLSAAVTIGAASDVAFQVSDVEISVLQQDPQDRSRLVPIATLVPNQPDAVYSVGPLAPEIGPLIFQNTDIFPNMVETLMKDPRGLLFKVANFNTTDEIGRNFAFSSQEVTERTATVTIDFGNGQSETHRIATAGRFDPQGVSLGISMEEALQAINLLPWPGEDPELGNVDDASDPRPKPTDADIQLSFGMRTASIADEGDGTVDVRVITRVRGVQDDFDLETVEPDKPNDGGFWAVFITYPQAQGANPNSPAFRGTANFDEVRLHAGETYMLAFVKDEDRDQLTSLEEFFSGSSDGLSDTDRDQLGDFLEVRGEWNADGLGAWLIYTNRLPGGYRTYSAPYLSDSDEDELTDDVEYALCRYRYDDGDPPPPPPEAFAIGTYDDTLTDPDDSEVAWENDIEPNDLPYAFPPSDGLPVDWHTQLDPNTGAPAEFPSNRASLDPRKMDTDEDGISDADEVNGYYVDLFDQDPTDGTRTRVFVYSDPLSTDTDRDNLLDGMELQFGTNPASDDSNTVFDDDLDGLPNRVEETGWLVDIGGVERRVFSDPDDPDSDNDYLPDYVEWVLGTSPWYYEGQTVDPDSAAPGFDTDQDGLSDSEEWDGVVAPQDQDKLAFCDLVPNCAGYAPPGTPYETDPIVADTDGDGLGDGFEVLTGWTVNLSGAPDGYPVFSDPLNPDTDSDGWDDGMESAHGTDPGKADTDEDLTTDAEEWGRVDSYGNHRNPLTPDQRVTVVYTNLYVNEDGNPGFDGGWPNTGQFYFRLGLHRPRTHYLYTWTDSWGCDDLYGDCTPGDDHDQRCMACDGRKVQDCENSNLHFDYIPSLSTRSFIMEEGELFTVEGYLTIGSPEVGCDYIQYECLPGNPAFDGVVYVVPVTSQGFIHLITDQDIGGDAVSIEITGSIEVD